MLVDEIGLGALPWARKRYPAAHFWCLRQLSMHDDVFRPGELCGTYRIIKLLGRGGFAEVYLAIDVTSQQRVALKCLQLRHLTNAQITQRMIAETELLAGLDHPNVIQVEDAGINGGVLWLAMEYIAGGTLRERLRKLGGPLPPLAALKYARQIAEGVGAAHGMQVVHRDLKPENIMITDRDEVKVLDLGAAKFFGKELTVTNPAGAIGTPLYMAPEQIKGEVVDARTDVYALGMIIYEMIAGRHPFAQPSGELPPAFELGALHLHAQPRPLSEIVEGLPEHVWRVVERALAKEPARRYASMDEFARSILTSRRRLLDDPGAGKVVGAIPLRRAPQYAEPSDVAAANENHSGVRGVDEFMGAQPSVDTLIDLPRAPASGDGEARGSGRSARGEGVDPGALSFSELVAQSGEIEGDAERVVAGSGRVPRALRAQPRVSPAAVEPPLEQSAPRPIDVGAEARAFDAAPEALPTTRSAGPLHPPIELAALQALDPVADAPVVSSGPITQRSHTGVAAPTQSDPAPTQSDVVPMASDVVPMLSDAAPTLTSAPTTLPGAPAALSDAGAVVRITAPRQNVDVPSPPRLARSEAPVRRRAAWIASSVALLIVIALVVGFVKRAAESIEEQATSALRVGELVARLADDSARLAMVIAIVDRSPEAQDSGAAQRDRGAADKPPASQPPPSTTDTSSSSAAEKCKGKLLFRRKGDPRCQRSSPAGAPSTASSDR